MQVLGRILRVAANRDEVPAAIAQGLADGDKDASGALNAMLLLGVLEDEPETRTTRACIPSFMRHIAQMPAPVPERDDATLNVRVPPPPSSGTSTPAVTAVLSPSQRL